MNLIQENFFSRKTLEVEHGCFRYGNLWMSHKGQFEPHDSDSIALSNEDEDNCQERVRRESQGHSTTFTPDKQTSSDVTLDSEVHVYGPAFSGSPDRTLVKFSVHTSIRPLNQDSMYLHELTIQPEQYGELYLPGAFRLIPPLPMLRQAYSALGYRNGILPLEKKRSFPLKLRTPSTPQLANVRFRIYNGNNHHVATVFVPIWLDG